MVRPTGTPAAGSEFLRGVVRAPGESPKKKSATSDTRPGNAVADILPPWEYNRLHLSHSAIVRVFPSDVQLRIGRPRPLLWQSFPVGTSWSTDALLALCIQIAQYEFVPISANFPRPKNPILSTCPPSAPTCRAGSEG